MTLLLLVSCRDDLREQIRRLAREGKRVDGRALHEHRPVRAEVGVLSSADGSATVSYGDTVVMAAVYGPREVHPRHIALSDRAVLRVRYHMAPFSTHEERKRPEPTRREIEISKVIREALEPVVILKQFPRASIDVFIEVLQADASTRVAAVTAASLALIDAGVPMRDFVVGVSIGKIEGKLVVDVNRIEDACGDGDMPIAVMYNKGLVTLMQADGQWTRDEVLQAIDLAFNAAKSIYGAMRDALKRRYVEVAELSEQALK